MQTYIWEKRLSTLARLQYVTGNCLDLFGRRHAKNNNNEKDNYVISANNNVLFAA